MRIRAAYDAIVVGLGAMGSAALYHGSRSSLKVMHSKAHFRPTPVRVLDARAGAI